MFGRFQLLRLLGKSERSMLWLAVDSRNDQEAMLAMPRVQPPTDATADAWAQVVQRGSRLTHPNLQPALEIGEHDYWPYVVYARAGLVTWQERWTAQGMPAAEMATWCVQALQGLAYAHEAGAAHRDLQPYMLLVDEKGVVSVLGLEVGTQSAATDNDAAFVELRSAREAAVQDVLALGLIAHQGLTGQPALDEADITRTANRLPPLGQEMVRLPWAVPRPIPDPLRAIVNRATDRQERHRYRNARTFCRALEGWLQSQADHNGGPLALLLDRLRTVGLLPALPGGADRAAKLAMLEQGHTSDLAAIVLSDIALTFELVRTVNSAQVHGASVSGDGPVLMVRRMIAMLGLDGVRRAALSLRPWPGPMNEAAAAEMTALVRRVKRAATYAQRLRPAGYDEEVVYLIALLQNLGRLVVQYHFPDESLQIRKLMQSTPPKAPGEPTEPGMSAEAASYAVLGIDIEAAGVAVGRHWGLDDSVLQMIRRLPLSTAPRHAETDNELLRAVASCANELADGLMSADKPVPNLLQNLMLRYGRMLGLTQKDLQEAVQGQGQGGVATAPRGDSSAAADEGTHDSATTDSRI